MIDLTPATLSAALVAACEASGGVLKWGQVARQFDTPADLDVFSRDLTRAGLLSGEAMAAIRERREQVGRGRG